MFAYIVGSIEQLVRNTSAIADKLREQMRGINRFLAHKQIPKEMRHKVRSYLGYKLDEKMEQQIDEDELMQQLNKPLQEELTVFYHGSVLHSFVPFDAFPIEFMSYLCFFVATENFSMGDTIFEVFVLLLG
jgi:cyclic nucleotide gated channel